MTHPLPATNCHLLILSLSGIGNYLMHTPFIEQVKKQRPGWQITLWCAPRGQAELARHNSHIDTVVEAAIHSPFIKDIPLIWQLRRGQYDAAVMLSPGQRLKGAAYVAAARIPRRLAHTYPLGRRQRSAFLLTGAIPEQPNTHDIEQNLALLPLLGLNTSQQTTSYSLVIPPASHAQADRLLSALKVPPAALLIGIHPGSASNATFKRWPLDRFAVLARALIENHKAHLLIFGGPEEEQLKNRLSTLLAANCSLLTTHYSLITASLLSTASLMQRCRLVIANDTGLMHLAAAAGTPTLGLFGSTDERQVGPRGPHSHTLRAPGTQPVYNTERNWQLENKPHISMQSLSTQLVIQTAINKPL